VGAGALDVLGAEEDGATDDEEDEGAYVDVGADHVDVLVVEVVLEVEVEVVLAWVEVVLVVVEVVVTPEPNSQSP